MLWPVLSNFLAESRKLSLEERFFAGASQSLGSLLVGTPGLMPREHDGTSLGWAKDLRI